MASRVKQHARTIARESALALLYSSDITEQSATDIIEAGQYPAEDIDFAPYAESLVLGVSEKLEEIDAKLAAVSENWTLERMPVVDRAILRLAVYEMLYVDSVPVSVAINEAVELAKAYGGEDDSPRFVNGVLGRIARLDESTQADEAPVDEPQASAVSTLEPESCEQLQPAPATGFGDVREFSEDATASECAQDAE